MEHTLTANVALLCAGIRMLRLIDDIELHVDGMTATEYHNTANLSGS